MNVVELEKIEKEQLRLSKLVKREDGLPVETIVTGIDVSYSDDKAIGCAVVSNYTTRSILGIFTHETTSEVEYIPSFFQLREGPIILELLDMIEQPGIAMIDGNGILHPRRFGLASYIGLQRDIRTIGVAKSLLLGDIMKRSGSMADIVHDDEIVGRAVWFGMGKPIYVSVGHRITLDTAVRIVREASIDGYPEVLRKAHMMSKDALRRYRD